MTLEAHFSPQCIAPPDRHICTAALTDPLYHWARLPLAVSHCPQGTLPAGQVMAMLVAGPDGGSLAPYVPSAPNGQGTARCLLAQSLTVSDHLDGAGVLVYRGGYFHSRLLTGLDPDAIDHLRGRIVKGVLVIGAEF